MKSQVSALLCVEKPACYSERTICLNTGFIHDGVLNPQCFCQSERWAELLGSIWDGSDGQTLAGLLPKGYLLRGRNLAVRISISSAQESLGPLGSSPKPRQQAEPASWAPLVPTVSSHQKSLPGPTHCLASPSPSSCPEQRETNECF